VLVSGGMPWSSRKKKKTTHYQFPPFAVHSCAAWRSFIFFSENSWAKAERVPPGSVNSFLPIASFPASPRMPDHTKLRAGCRTPPPLRAPAARVFQLNCNVFFKLVQLLLQAS
jgi:hypothetical protein